MTLTLGIINFKAESKFIVDWFHEINDKKMQENHIDMTLYIWSFAQSTVTVQNTII